MNLMSTIRARIYRLGAVLHRNWFYRIPWDEELSLIRFWRAGPSAGDPFAMRASFLLLFSLVCVVLPVVFCAYCTVLSLYWALHDLAILLYRAVSWLVACVVDRVQPPESIGDGVQIVRGVLCGSRPWCVRYRVLGFWWTRYRARDANEAVALTVPPNRIFYSW